MDDNVYLGVWTNWSRGSVFGPTLTLQRDTGNLLIAFTASFIGFVAARFWKILCLGFHRCWSTSKPRPAIHHQRQVVLRNSSAPEAGLLSFLRLLWAWRHARTKSFFLVALLAFLALFSLAGFTVAGGFSSSISTAAGDEVLLRGDNCGIVAPLVDLGTSTIEDAQANTRVTSEEVNDALSYATQCYGNSSQQGDMECNKFIVGQIATVVDDKAGCPFDDSICRSTGANIQLDSGYMDSNDHLGLNTPEDERFALRYVMQCAPLKTEGYTSTVDFSNRTWVRYHYGNVAAGSSDNVTYLNYTHQVQDLKSQYVYEGPGSWLEGKYFILSSRGTTILDGKPDGDSWTPIPELMTADGDPTLVFLSGNGVRFIQAMDDGWYQVTTPGGTVRDTGGSGSASTYVPDQAALPMGCVERWQWCNSAYPRETGCGPLASGYDAMFGAAPLFNLTVADFDPARPVSPTETGNRFIWPVLIFWGYPSILPAMLKHLGARALESQTLLSDGIQWPLPDNQWHVDVKRWFSTMLASIQASFVDTALGNTNPEFEQYVLRPLTDGERALCSSQKIHSSGYTSFSMFGLCFTFVTGALIIAVSFLLEPVISLLYHWRGYKPYAFLEWNTNTNLQLQRFAHEELGLVQWEECTGEVPTTHPDINLASLDITDPKHPVLSRGPLDIAEQDTWNTPEKPGGEDLTAVETIQGVECGTQPEAPMSPTEGTLTIGRASTENSSRYNWPISAVSSVGEAHP
ncbi:hypothetical protein GGR53DRAFT_469785 [Hypoxylon sp. FL1150]|nr:hypothetical protein GGR53DRAFT_469785 [Hypoxylon sp. FL1150]